MCRRRRKFKNKSFEGREQRDHLKVVVILNQELQLITEHLNLITF